MAKQFDLGEFMRQLYLNAEPSIDLAVAKGPIDPCEYRLKISDLERIEAEFGVQKGTDLAASVAMFILNKGPQLTRG